MNVAINKECDTIVVVVVVVIVIIVINVVIILQACKECELGNIDIDEEGDRRQEELYVPNWFSCDIKTGVSPCTMEDPSHSIQTPFGQVKVSWYQCPDQRGTTHCNHCILCTVVVLHVSIIVSFISLLD